MSHFWQSQFSCAAESTNADNYGLLLTAGGSANTKGAWASGTSGFTNSAYESLMVTAIGASAAANFVFDIGVGDGSVVTVLASDIRYSSLKAANSGGISLFLPVSSGPINLSRVLMMRCASSTASATMNLSVIGITNGLRGMPGFNQCIPFYTPSSSRGVAVDGNSTTANSYGSWTEITSSTSSYAAGLIIMTGPNTDIARTGSISMALDIGIGAANSEKVLFPKLVIGAEAGTDLPMPYVFGPLPCAIPPGNRIAARLKASTTTAGDRSLDVAVYGLVP